jgi:hypothetical protein
LRELFDRFPNEAALRLLLACGSRWLDVDAVESSSGDTPLHVICRGNANSDIIQLLLSHDCNIECVNQSGKIPSDYVKDKVTRTLLTSRIAPKRRGCFCASRTAIKRFKADTSESSTTLLNKYFDLHRNLSLQPKMTDR